MDLYPFFFDEEDYLLRDFEGNRIHPINPKGPRKGAGILSNWTQNAFESYMQNYFNRL